MIKNLKNALLNKDGFWAIVCTLATVIVGLDTIALMLTGNPAWYGAFLFTVGVLGCAISDGKKVIERYKGEL